MLHPFSFPPRSPFTSFKANAVGYGVTSPP